MEAKDRVYQALCRMAKSDCQITAAALAEELNLSRQVVSHYLNRLLEEGCVEKTLTRPVCWNIRKQQRENVQGSVSEERKEIEEVLPEVRREDVFDAMIGADGSQKNVIERCKAAVSYPPDGLPILITGESGVGKSFLARLIHQYAISRAVIRESAPLVVLNCADYANNPKLLSAALLGYKKGSFTGADTDKEGLLQEADGGYLFLDEVHRLSYENQEKLFVFMDTGRYRPLGDKNWKAAKVRFIFATTEVPEKVLLETFRRRITVQISIGSIAERPLMERLQLIYRFYQKEAVKINKDILIEKDAMQYLCFSKLPGNIGKLENLVQVSCAEAYFRQQEKELLKISSRELQNESPDKDDSLEEIVCPMKVLCSQECESAYEACVTEHTVNVSTLWEEVVKASWDEIDMLYLRYKHQMKTWEKYVTVSSLVFENTAKKMFESSCRLVLKRYGIRVTDQCLKELYLSYKMFSQMELDAEMEWKLSVYFEQALSRAHYIAKRLFEKVASLEQGCEKHVLFLFTLALHEYVAECVELAGLIAAHGDTTASSIAKVVNQACETFVFEAIDMPMDSSFDATIEKVKSYLEDIPGGRGLILLVDTGSLSRMYTLIKNSLSGDLMIINNVSTAIALDIGIKMLGHSSFTEITQSTKKLCSFDVQFFEGLSQGKNIVISCMSGVGIAEKIQEMMKSVFGDCGLDFITMDYKELIRALDENDEKSFEQTLLILTTSSLSEGVKTPWLSMYDVLDGSGEQVLWDSLKTVINPERFEVLKREFVKFFSMEGIVSRLQFLNPAVVVQEVELILMRYEQYYTLEMSGYVRLNLYMHIAFMFERLMIAQDDYEEEQRELSEQEQEFYRISRIVFSEAEKKYRIRLDEYELSMLYELFKSLIK